MSLSITWLGHSAFLIGLPSGQRILTDPWLTNPNCPPAYSRPDGLGQLDLILVSHGHDDHLGETMTVARASGAPVVGLFELAEYLKEKGLKDVQPMGIGGTIDVGGVTITMTQAVHSGALVVRGQNVYLGGAAGFVLRSPGTPTLYFAGDTGLFGDMRMLGEVYAPEIAFLPIGDRYTMGPDTAALAARWLRVRQVVPMHWGTAAWLTGTPAELKAALAGTAIEVLELEPGQTAE